jgi:hypothetical protein
MVKFFDEDEDVNHACISRVNLSWIIKLFGAGWAQPYKAEDIDSATLSMLFSGSSAIPFRLFLRS